jgi:hypothetical protein
MCLSLFPCCRSCIVQKKRYSMTSIVVFFHSFILFKTTLKLSDWLVVISVSPLRWQAQNPNFSMTTWMYLW